jgi:hypothetical protein
MSAGDELLLEIARCPVLESCTTGSTPQHGCAEIVLCQWPGVPVGSTLDVEVIGPVGICQVRVENEEEKTAGRAADALTAKARGDPIPGLA